MFIISQKFTRKMNRKKYLYLYLAILAFLFVHFAIAKFYSEPFPAFIFPSFSNVQKVKETYRIPVIDMYAIDSDNDTLLVDKGTELAPATMIFGNSVLKTIRRKEKLIHEQLLPTEKNKQLKNLPKVLSQRKTFLTMVKENLVKNYPTKKFKSLLIVEGILCYDLSSRRLSDTLLNKKATSIQLQ